MTMAAEGHARELARVGRVLKDKWRLDALIGVGGMAAVYAATHRNQKRVAIKMLLPELAHDAQVRERFVREGYAANTIGHPGALSVLDDDVADEGLPFLVMEFLDGETVEARWERAGRRLELPEVLTIAAHVLDVLAAAHAKGVVHRDIKPENLFLLRTGGLKVLDFGIARVLEQRGTETRVGTVMGTPAFMSPEQALAKWDEVDGRTDLWAVGAMMFTLVSGEHVHEAGTGNEQLIKSATQPARSVGSVVKGLPRSAIALIDRALKFDRTARWPDARAMQEAACGAYEALTGRTLVIEAPSVSGPLSQGDRPASTTTASGQRPAVTVPRRSTSSGAFNQATMLAAGAPLPGGPGVDAFIAGRTAERDAALSEVARLSPIVEEVQGRLAAERRRAAQVQEQIAAVRKDRATEEERFRRQTESRLEGLGEARKAYRRAMGEVAHVALADASAFPPDVGAAERAAITQTRATAETRTRESALHDAALASYDEQTLKKGLVLGTVAAVLLLLLFFSPVIIRSFSSDGTGTIAPAPVTNESH
jgi:hypothetical protein